jgi:phosphohistidine phosphatase
MKTLWILRHAKSEWDEPGVADHDRPLNSRGKREAPRVGQHLRAEGWVPDLIISSTAKRARKTAKLVSETSGYEGEVLLKDTLYLAGPEDYLEVLHAAPETCQSVMVVGHNPGLEELVEALTGEAETLPTAALAQIELPITRWQDLDEEIEGKLVSLWRPRDEAGG